MTAVVRPCAMSLMAAFLLGSCQPDASEVAAAVDAGVVLAEEGKFSEAKEVFLRAISLDSTYAEAHLRLGSMHEVADALAAAKREYAIAARLDSSMAAAHYNYGLMLAKEGDHQNAADAFNRAIDILAVDPDSALAPLPHYCLGLIHAARGEYDDALQAYNRALEFSSDLPYVHNELGKVYKQRDQLEESEAAYKRALELKADLLGAHYDLMTVYMRMRRPDLAAKHKRLFEQFRDQQGG